MTTKKISLINNGTRYFDRRISMFDEESYNKAVQYLEMIAVKTEVSEGDALKGRRNYILDNGGKEVARIIPYRKVIELTKDVEDEIKDNLERIIAGYNPRMS